MKKLEEMTSNKFKHINLAVASEEGEVMFYETLDYESGSLYKDHKNIVSDRVRSYTVKTTTISGLVKYLNLHTVDLIKLDLEGAAVGAMSLVNMDIDPWTINVGIPSKYLKERKRDILQHRLNIQYKDYPNN